MHRVAHCILLLSVSTVLALPSNPLGSTRPCVRTRSCGDGSRPKVAPQATSTPKGDRALNSSSHKGQYHRELSESGKEHPNSSSRFHHTVAAAGVRRNRTTGRTNPRLRLGSRLHSWRLRMCRVNGKAVPCRRPLRTHHVVKTNASSVDERGNLQRSSQRKPGHQVWRQNATHKERQFEHITGKHSDSGLHSDGSPQRKQAGDSRRRPLASNDTLHGAELTKNRSSSLSDYRLVNATRADPFPSSPPIPFNSLRRTRRSARVLDTSSSEEDSSAIWSSVSRSRPQVYKYWRGAKKPYRQTHSVAVRPLPQAERVVPVRIYQTRYPVFVGTHVAQSRLVPVRFPKPQVFDVQLERQRRRAGAEQDFEKLDPNLLHSSAEERLLDQHQPFSQANAILMGYSAPSLEAFIGEPPSVLYRPRHHTQYTMIVHSDPSEDTDESSSDESSEESSNKDLKELKRSLSQSISKQQEEQTQLPYTSSLVARLLADHADPNQLLRDLQHEVVASDQRARPNSNPRTSEVDRSDDLDSKLSSESESESESESDENSEKSAESSSSSSSSEEDDTRESEPDADSAVEDLSDAEFELKKERHKRNIREPAEREYADDSGSRENDGKDETVIDRWLRQLLLREATRKGTRRVHVRSGSGDAEEDESESESHSSSDSSSSEEESSKETLSLARRADAGARADEIISREADYSLPSEGLYGSARSRDWSAVEGETSSSESSSSSEEEHANTKRALHLLPDKRVRDKRAESSEEQSDVDYSSSDEEDRSSSSSSSEEGAELTKRTRLQEEPHLASQLASLDRLARALVH